MEKINLCCACFLSSERKEETSEKLDLLSLTDWNEMSRKDEDGCVSMTFLTCSDFEARLFFANKDEISRIQTA